MMNDDEMKDALPSPDEPFSEAEPMKKTTPKPASASKTASKPRAQKTPSDRVNSSTANTTAQKRPTKPTGAKPEHVSLKVSRSQKPAHRVIPYLLGVVAVFFLVCLTFNLFCNLGNKLAENPSAHWMGSVGYWICYGLFGWFGPAVFVFPFLIFNLAFYWKKYIDNRLTLSKILVSAAFLILLATLIHVFCLTQILPEERNLSRDVLIECGAEMTGGGLIGGTLGYLAVSYLNVPGALIVCFVLLFVSLFYFLGMTPHYLFTKLVLWRKLRLEKRVSLSEQEAEHAKREAKDRIERMKKGTELTSGEVTSEGYPAGAVTVYANGKKEKREREEENDLPPMPALDRRTDELYVPAEVRRRVSEEEKAEIAVQKPVEQKPAVQALPKSEPIPAKIPQQMNPITASNIKRMPSETPAAQPAVPVRPVARQTQTVVDPIFPRGNEAKTVRRVQKEDRNFDLKNVFIDLDEKPTPKTVTHAPLPPEKPLPGSTRPIQTAPEQPSSAIPMPPPASRPAQPVKPQAPSIVSPAPVKPAEKTLSKIESNSTGFGLSEEIFEKMEQEKGVGVKIQEGTKPVIKKPAAPIKPAEKKPEAKKAYVFPPISYLQLGTPMAQENVQEIRDCMNDLSETLKNFHVGIRDEIRYACGPTVTRYEIIPAPGVRVKNIFNLSNDIALALRSSGGVRIDAIAGTNAIGIEIPNKTRTSICLRDLIESKEFAASDGKLCACLGADITGRPVIFDLEKMPHLLVAGTTGSGKSVCINSILISLLYRCTPEDVRFVMIDPKKVEFTPFQNIPHLIAPVITTAKDASGALQAAVDEMERRYELMEGIGVKTLKSYNEATANDPDMPHMSRLVIIIDELAELMMQAKNEVETAIVRIAQKGRAAGLHLLIGTQRPSVDVVTGLIKANIPSCIAFAVRSQVDSRVILDHIGAETLLGKGDMLFVPIGARKDERVQGAFVDEKEVQKICDFLRTNDGPVAYDEHFVNRLKELAAQAENKGKNDFSSASEGGDDKDDPKYLDAMRIALEENRISTSLLQRKLEIGYGRAAKIIDRMEAEGLVSAGDGAKARTIQFTREQYMDRVMNADGEKED